MAGLSSKLAQLNPFSKGDDSDNDDGGAEIDATTHAGAGHASRPKSDLRVSPALRSFLAHSSILSEEDAGASNDASSATTPALQELLEKPHICVPAEVKDRSRPLPEYFVSSSHNTYLMAHQLFGSSNATAYETALRTGSRCVEIDAWDGDDNKDEPKVTHGFTLVSNIPFRAVCETIRDMIDQEAATGGPGSPILLSLENHCAPHGQLRLAQIMQEVFADRLLSSPVEVEGLEPEQHVPLAALGNKVVVIVEYHYPDEPESSSSSSSSSESEDDEKKKSRHQYKEKKKKGPPPKIIPELAALGVYAQSVKPADNSWFDPGVLNAGPHHHLINVSETGLWAHLPKNSPKIAKHNAKHLMRVYPKGTRISSRNLNPVPFWGLGAQVCALNWQNYGGCMQMNSALFADTDGYVLKPPALRAGGSGKLGTGILKTLRLHVAGATDVPMPKGRDADNAIKPYLTCQLYHPDSPGGKCVKKKTAPYKPHKLGFLHKGETGSPPTDPVWDQTLEWEFEENEMTFLRMLIKSDDGFSANPNIVVHAVRLSYVPPGWRFHRMLDLHGHDSACSVLLNFEVVDS